MDENEKLKGVILEIARHISELENGFRQLQSSLKSKGAISRSFGPPELDVTRIQKELES